MYAVTGITGKVGGAVARTLLAAGLPVRAVVRDADKGWPWAKQGCEIAIASIADADGLTKAFSGVAGVFLMTAQSRFEPSGRAPTSANKRGPRGPARLVKHREDFPESNISKGFAACQVLCAIELVEGLARDLLRGKA